MSQPDPTDPFNFLKGEPGEPDTEQQLELDEATEVAQLAQLETTRMIHQVMNSGRGPEFLEWLRSVTVEVQLIDINGVFGVGNHSLPMTAPEWALYRDGQNSFYHLIKACIKAAEEGDTASAEQPKQEN